ncbi:MAG TPA: SDR family NAD(P)-dependent oxidoreductase [Acidimicrobiia bacterium]|nr:SDR family NAD(P)-dependent oxidoreductase [Acidimicrobiia bacterium]
MAWSTSDIPDLAGKTAVVTGANGGLGLETSRALAVAGCHVVMASRNQDKAADAAKEILGASPGASLESVPLDLGSLESIETAAVTILATHKVVNLLVNNAGLMAMPEGRTGDGFETQLGVNHLGHWALTAHLLPALLRSDTGRVVTVTSTAHHFGRPIDPANPHLEGRYDPWRAYGQSKLANYHFALGLHGKFEEAGVVTASLLAHPGLTNTDLQANTVRHGGASGSGEFWHRLAQRTGMSSATGALPQLRAATDPRARSGQMYAPRFINAGAPVRRPILRRFGMERAIDTLWGVSEDETGMSIDLG